MAATLSLSKGVFAFKKQKLKKNKILDNGSCISKYWRTEDGRDDPDIRKLTSENYQNVWANVTEIVESLLDNIHSKVFEDLVQYVKRVGNAQQFSADSYYNLNNHSSYLGKDIPTACLVTGVNMPDHDSVFESLTKSLKANVTPFVVRISSSLCTSVKAVIFYITLSLMKDDEISSLIDSDEEEVIAKSPKKRGLRKSQCNMGVLAAWYKETAGVENESMRDSPRKKFKKSPGTKSPRKRQKVDTAKRPVIIIIEDVEGVPSSVLQDIILICSSYRRSLPFVFVLGVATTPSAIHRYLSQDSSTHLAIETFQAQPSSILLSQIIEEVLMSSLPFHLGGKVFKLLLDIFLFHDLSVSNFISGLKFCMLEHFLRGNVSFLCCNRKSRKRIMKKLSPSCLQALRDAASVISYIECLSESEKKLMIDDDYFKKAALDQLKNLEYWYESFCIMVKILHQLVYNINGTPLGKQVRELYSMCLSQQVTDTAEFQESWKLLSLCAKEELMPKLISVQEVLKEYPDNEVAKELDSKLRNFYDRLKNIDNMSISNQLTDTSPAKPATFELKPSDRFHLREKLLGTSKKKVKNPYEELRSEIVSTFEHLFISILKPPHNKPFNEVLFFDTIGGVKYQLLGSLRATITTGLTNPQKYLQCKCCQLEDTSNVLTSLPDLSICYKLYLECGRLINLYDWLQAFIAVLGSNEPSVNEQPIIKKKGKLQQKKTKIDEQIQARFIQAVSELQLLGFVKPTKKKTDHVQRLTWGGC